MSVDAGFNEPRELPPSMLSDDPRLSPLALDTVSILGVPVRDMTMDSALDLLEKLLLDSRAAKAVFFVNAHTLNQSFDVPGYRAVLRGADHIFGDGTGVRWAARMLHGRALRANVNGTDVVPLLFSRLAGRGLSYFLLGNSQERILRAAAYARSTFPGWTQVGVHHGFLDEGDDAGLIEQINMSGASLLLVGMGNPKQEQWIARHLPQLRVPLCMGTGGLFDYWVGDLVRAPAWIRRIGYEWLHLLISQPHKCRRYLLGNPKFLLRAAHSRMLGLDARKDA